MLIIVNEAYGGYSLNKKWEAFADERGLNYDDEIIRTNPELIAEIQSGNYENERYSNLKVKEIPEDATDYEIIDYDGLESIVYVVDGKLYSI